MRRKEIYVNDQLVGEARSWKEVYALLQSKGISFLGQPGAAEGPSGFFLNGQSARSAAVRLRTADNIA